MEAAALGALVHGREREAECQQLTERKDPLLPGGNDRNRRIDRGVVD
jgi:hypothetical protein